MIRKRYVLLACLVLTACAGNTADLAVQADVDLEKYMGTWYEQARLPNKFQQSCVGEVRADYALLPEQRVSVTNQCITRSGSIEKAQALGRLNASIVPPSTSKLEVRFAPAWLSWLPSVWGAYWIMKVQGDYEYALVGTPSREYLWVLSRQAQGDKAIVQDLLNHAQKQGFAIENVIWDNTR